MLLTLLLVSPRSSLRGYCRRYLLEPFPNLFIGKVSKVFLQDVFKRIREGNVQAVAIVSRGASDIGCDLVLFGSHSKEVVDCDGLTLIRNKSVR